MRLKRKDRKGRINITLELRALTLLKNKALEMDRSRSSIVEEIILKYCEGLK